MKKEPELRHGGAYYHISPWGLLWDHENYYLIGYDSRAEQIRHYRVDKMLHILLSEEIREGKEEFQKIDMASYSKKKSFGMFGGKEQSVKLLVEKFAGRCYCRSFRERCDDDSGGCRSFHCECRRSGKQSVHKLGICAWQSGKNCQPEECCKSGAQGD